MYGCFGAANSSSVGASSTILPRYMTATRSQRYSTVARSCVMKRHEKPSSLLQVAQQVEDRRLHGDVERRHRLVGDEQRRRHRERPREPDTLALAARELVRVPEAKLVAQADLVEQLDDPRVEVAPARETLHGQRLAHDLPTRHARVERRVRILEHHVHVAPERPQRAPRQVRDVRALQPDRPVGRRRRAA